MSDAPSPQAIPPRAGRRRLVVVIVAVLVVAVVVLASLLAALAATPTREVRRMAVEWHTLTTVGQYYSIYGGFLVPEPSVCLGSTGAPPPYCTYLWVALNWSTRDGHAMTFQLNESTSNITHPFVVVYDSQNMSFGGYSLVCGSYPQICGNPFLVLTNDTTGRTWNADWGLVYNYTTTEPGEPFL